MALTPGDAETAAAHFTIVESCKMIGVDPREFYLDAVNRIHTKRDPLTPIEYKQSREINTCWLLAHDSKICNILNAKPAKFSQLKHQHVKSLGAVRFAQDLLNATWRGTATIYHISVDAATQEVVAVSLTKSNVHDSLEMKNLLPEEIEIKDVAADKAYDNFHAYDPIAAKNAKATIPPRSGAALTKKPSPGMILRNNSIREKWRWGAKSWKQGRRYHRRSLVETAFCRYKKVFGERMQTKNIANQRVEVRLKAKLLNDLTHLGMPNTIKIL